MTYVPGDWKAVCSMCGFERLASELVKNWQGQWRCPEHNEPRHPQEYVKAPAVEKPTSFSQPAGVAWADGCSTHTAVAGDAIAGCMIAGSTLN